MAEAGLSAFSAYKSLTSHSKKPFKPRRKNVAAEKSKKRKLQSKQSVKKTKISRPNKKHAKKLSTTISTDARDTDSDESVEISDIGGNSSGNYSEINESNVELQNESDESVNNDQDGQNYEILVNGNQIAEENGSNNFESPIPNFDSVENGKELFSWVIKPSETKTFFNNFWEKKPLIVKRYCPMYYSVLLSCEEIDKVLRKKTLNFTRNIDITSFSDGKRETHNPEGRAFAPVVWDYYNNGCSVRIINPQSFFHKIHVLNAKLQEFFGCMVGANVYLTPPGTQGFAPHYDDIEAFVLQIEGKKRWKLYVPRCPGETLPRYSSGNLKEEDLDPPVAEHVLEAGDLMYFPRGTIHQAQAVEDTHSLHITLSVYQRTSWADLLEKLLPAALKIAVEENIEFRKGLPLQYLSYMGLVHSDETSNERTSFMEKLQELMGKMLEYVPTDAAVDQLGKNFIHDSLPPVLSRAEQSRTVFGDGERIINGQIENQAEIGLDTRIKLLRYNSIRLVKEDEDTLKLYYSISNSRVYHEEEIQFLEISENLAPAVDALIRNYPNFLLIEDLPLENDVDKVQIASDLWENGLLITEEPLGYTSD